MLVFFGYAIMNPEFKHLFNNKKITTVCVILISTTKLALCKKDILEN